MPRPRSRTGYRGRARAPRQKVAWYDTTINAILMSDQRITQDLSKNMSAADKRGARVLRIIVNYEYNMSIAGTGGLVSYGLCIWPDEASSVLPDPDSEDQDVQWLWKRTFDIVSSSNASDSTQFTKVSIDVKPNRRLPTHLYSVRLIHKAEVLSDNVNVNGMVRLLMSVP